MRYTSIEFYKLLLKITSKKVEMKKCDLKLYEKLKKGTANLRTIEDLY